MHIFIKVDAIKIQEYMSDITFTLESLVILNHLWSLQIMKYDII